jgi:asparagine synthase (glutamine-hydrolysing)
LTAIAGTVGSLPVGSLERRCAVALAAQRIYARRPPIIRIVDHAAFGVALYATLPEDCYDRQPLKDERFLLVADIRLDNRNELARMLGARPETFAQRSDADLLFQAWARWQDQCLDRIVGDYAFAVFDTHSRRLVLARDSGGERPLCYAQRNELVSFASMPSGLLSDGPMHHDLVALAIRLTNPPATGGHTCFEEVRTLLPGQMLSFSPSGMEAKFHFQPSTRERLVGPKEDLVPILRQTLDDAVQCRMRHRSGAIATQLSSGYDSSAVTGTAARLRGPEDRLIAFTSAPLPNLPTLVPRGRIADESTIAAKSAAWHGIEHVVVRNSEAVLDVLKGHARYFQSPVSNPLNQGWWNAILHTASSMGAETMLIGGAGNFTINYGGLPVLAHWIQTGRFFRWWEEARAAVDKNDIRWRGALLSSFAPWLPRSVMHGLERAFRGNPSSSRFSFVRDDLLASIGPSHPVRPKSLLSGDLHAGQLSFFRESDSGFFRKGVLALTGIEERDPLADRRLIQFSLTIPSEMLLHNGVYRPLAKAALADRVPQSVLFSQLRGYQGADWWSRMRQSEAYALLEEISASSTARDLLNINKLRHAVDHWPPFDQRCAASLYAFGRSLANALAVGHFVAETQRNPTQLGI